MGNSIGKAEPEKPTSLLDNTVTSARKPWPSPAQRRFNRIYNRARTGLGIKGQYRFVTLTSSPDAGDFQRDFRKLFMRLSRRGLIQAYIRVPEYTKSGLRHDHIIFRGSYIEHQYLSYLWAEIHKSPVVDIRKMRGKHKLASYLASYISKAPCGRYSYSWSWCWQGMAKSWRFLVKLGMLANQDFKAILTIWQKFVSMRIKPDSALGVMWLNKYWRLDYGKINYVYLKV